MSEYEWPIEIRNAVDALESDHEWKILAAVVDGSYTFDELRDIFEDATEEEIDIAVSNLTRGGLAHKRVDGDLGCDKFAYRVELSTYGSRFVGGMFATLGSLDELAATGSAD